MTTKNKTTNNKQRSPVSQKLPMSGAVGLWLSVMAMALFLSALLADLSQFLLLALAIQSGSLLNSIFLSLFSSNGELNYE